MIEHPKTITLGHHLSAPIAQSQHLGESRCIDPRRRT
jgi:hypothetical protein